MANGPISPDTGQHSGCIGGRLYLSIFPFATVLFNHCRGRRWRIFFYFHHTFMSIFTIKFQSNPIAVAAIAFLAAAVVPNVSHATEAKSEATPTIALGEITVTANRMPTRTEALVSDVTIINRDAIESNTGRTLSEVLSRQAGLQMNANGGLGSYSGVFVRGTEARHVLLLVDGVRYGSATTGQANWDNLPLEMIERIEVLKGPASALYGSEAVGGVVQIFLKKSASASASKTHSLAPHAALTISNKGLTQIGVDLAGNEGALSYALGAQKINDKGFSSTNPDAEWGNYNADRDGFNQSALNASLGYKINNDWRLDGGVLYAKGLTHYDDGPVGDTRTQTVTQTLRASVEGNLLPNWKTQLRLSQSKDQQNGIEGAYLPSKFNTTQTQFGWQNDVVTPFGMGMVGVENLVQAVNSSTTYDVEQRSVQSIFAGLNGESGIHTWQVNVRSDANSQFGHANTGFAGYGLKINRDWRLHTSVGNSFVAPSFNQLYYPNYGTATLQPEKGRNMELGVSYAANGQNIKAVYFDNKIKGFIVDGTKSSNIPRANISGWTLSYEGHLPSLPKLQINASADLLNPTNELTGKQLSRRAKIQTKLGVSYPVAGVVVAGDVLHVGKRFDDTQNTTPLASYTTFDLSASYDFANSIQLQAKLNNATNVKYETAKGYNQAPRTFLLTVRYSPK